MQGVSLVTELKKENNDFSCLSDEELTALAQSGSADALEAIISRYKGLVYSKSKLYFLAGADKDDIVQEGLIGLYKAVKDFDIKKSAHFKAFAGVCVSRQIISAVKAASRKKHIPLNSYVSLDNSVFDDENDANLLEFVTTDEALNPEEILIDRENTDGIEYKINKALSKFESGVLLCYLDGMSYQEIAAKERRDVKAVDNAIQRIKKKLAAALGFEKK